MKYNFYDSKYGKGAVVFSDRGLFAVLWPEKDELLLEAKLADFDGEAEFDPFVGQALAVKIEDYLGGKKTDFDEPLDQAGWSYFQAKVYEALRRIPYGQTVSYGQLAKTAGYPGAARAVGTAMAKNRCPLVVPCHRVVKGDGHLGNWSGPQGFKEVLWKMESGK